MIVLDCSAAVAIMRDTAEGRAFRLLMEKGEMVIAPELFFAELGNALWKYARIGEVKGTQVKALFKRCASMVDRFYADGDLSVEAVSEAIRLDHSVYDMLYLVLARRMGATLFTLDRRLQALCMRQGVECTCFVDIGASDGETTSRASDR